jgi:glycosyltransferase involved in cell wall biosynthesis
MRIPRDRIEFTPNGVEEPKLSVGSTWRERLRLRPEEALVVKVANVTGFKDHLTLLRAWKIVQDHWHGADRPLLALAGACYFDELYNNCLRFVRESRIETTVRFLESIPDVPALLQVSDIAVFSSRNEGMPNGVLECMAAGKPVIASDLPGVRDALGASAADALVTPGDADGFARSLLELLRNNEKRQSWGAQNLARIRSEFSIQRMAERHLEVIRDVMAASMEVKLRATAIGIR